MNGQVKFPTKHKAELVQQAVRWPFANTGRDALYAENTMSWFLSKNLIVYDTTNESEYETEMIFVQLSDDIDSRISQFENVKFSI